MSSSLPIYITIGKNRSGKRTPGTPSPSVRPVSAGGEKERPNSSGNKIVGHRY